MTALFFSGAFCMQQKPALNYFEKPQTLVGLHSHSEEAFALNELLEIIFTGHVNHIHAHSDHDDETSHTHPHEHTSPKFVSMLDFLPVGFNFIFDNFKSPWPSEYQLHGAISFQSEILRPPIS